MERTLSSELFFDHAHAHGGSAFALRILRAFMRWRRHAISRRQLAGLDPRLLADAGITEAQRQSELSKPFWR